MKKLILVSFMAAIVQAQPANAVTTIIDPGSSNDGGVNPPQPIPPADPSPFDPPLLGLPVTTPGDPFPFDPDPVSPIPEPATWAMMLIGFGFVGGAMRAAKRRQNVTLSYA